MKEQEQEQKVAEMLSEIREKGDAAVSGYTRQFDGMELQPSEYALPEERIRGAWHTLTPSIKRAFEEAASRIRRFHEEFKPSDHFYTGPDGEILGETWNPVSSAGIYAPGGRAAYPSSVLMAAVPAQVAGVERIVVTSPPGAEGISDLVLAACSMLDITEVYQLGGVQAVGALAFGTETIQPVQKIAGPGNAYVTCAKKLLYGTVGIDLLAGPSEVVVVCDESASCRKIALELLAQAEHDPRTRVFCLIAGSVSVEKIEAEIEKQLPGLPGYAGEIAARRDVFRTFPDLASALREANRIAPEHLSLKIQNPFAALRLVDHAGAVMLGSTTPVAFGDYFAGPSHVLPTDGAAGFSSGLSTGSFMKSTHVLYTPEQYRRKWGGLVAEFARSEGLEAHARSAGGCTDQGGGARDHDGKCDEP